jgi:hypothetical protein
MALAWSTVMIGGQEGQSLVRGKGELLKNGSVFEYEGVFSGGLAGQGVLAVCLRKGPVPRSYYVRAIAAENEFMRWHMLERDDGPATFLVRFAHKVEDLKAEKLNGEDVEMARAYRVFSEGEEFFDPQEISWVPEGEHARLKREVLFTKDMLAAEVVAPPEVR